MIVVGGKMKDPLVSVIMVTYNHIPFISNAIEGVLSQEAKFPFELVIGEDCSTDGTREIVLEYQRKYPDIIRVITSESNVGMKKNGLRTLKACRGKYLAFCEGDDHWHHPGKMRMQAAYLENHPACGLVYSSYDVYHVSSGKRIPDFIKYRKWEMPENPTIRDIVENKGGRSRGITTCTVMLRRDLCEEIKAADPYLHQSDHFIMGDSQLWAEMATRASLHFIPESLATHNITQESATRSRDMTKVIRFGISAANLQLYLCDKYDLPSHIRTRYREYLLNCQLQLAFHTRDRELAETVRREKKRFTVWEWLRYYGAGNRMVHYACRLVSPVLRRFRPRHRQWA